MRLLVKLGLHSEWLPLAALFFGGVFSIVTARDYLDLCPNFRFNPPFTCNALLDRVRMKCHLLYRGHGVVEELPLCPTNNFTFASSKRSIFDLRALFSRKQHDKDVVVIEGPLYAHEWEPDPKELLRFHAETAAGFRGTISTKPVFLIFFILFLLCAKK